MNSADRVELSNSGTRIVARLKGAIDIANAATIEAELCHAVPNTASGLIVDLSEVTFMDSTGLRVLFVLDEKLRSRQQDLRLVLHEGSNLFRTLTLVHMQDFVPICEDVDAAGYVDALPRS